MLQDIKVFISKHRKAVILNMAVVCVCYAHMAFSMNVGIDTEDMINQKDYVFRSWEGIGRQGLVLTKILLNLTDYNPYFAGVVFLFSFLALGILTAFFCWLSAEKNDKYPYGLFLVLFSTCPVWMMQFYFALQRAEVMLALIFTLVSVLCFQQFVFYKKRNIFLIPFYLVLGVWSFCSYQGCVMFYIGLCIIFVLMDFAEHCKDRRWQDYAGMILKLIGGFLVIFLLNTVITRMFFGMAKYLQGQIGWGQAGISEILYRIAYHVGHVLFCLKAEYCSVYPLACVCAAMVFFCFCRKKEVQKSMKVLLLLILAGLLLTPFLLTVYMGNVPAPRSQFVLPLISAFACMFACGVRKGEEDRYAWYQRGILAVSAVSVWCCLSLIFRLQYTDDLRYQEDVRVAETIAEDIRHTKGAEGLPVVFVGKYTSRLNHSAWKADVYGASFLGWDCTEENPTGATRRIVGFMKTLGIEAEGIFDKTEEAVAVSRKMESYPGQDYISVQDGFVVVKLSEVNR